MGWGYGRSFESTQGITGRASYKRIFTTGMCVHVWAQRKQAEGRSGKGSIYFNGDTIYSYGSHFPMGHFTDHVGPKGLPFAFVNVEDYSAQTDAHVRMTISAIDATKWQIVRLHTNEMLQAMRGDIEGALDAMLVRNVAKLHDRLNELLNVRKQFFIKGHQWVEVPPNERAALLTDDDLRELATEVGRPLPLYDLVAMRSQIETMGAEWLKGEPKREKDRARRAKRASIDGFMKYYEKLFVSRGYVPWRTEEKLKQHLNEVIVHRPDFAPQAMQMYGERLAKREIDEAFRERHPDFQQVIWKQQGRERKSITIGEWLMGAKGAAPYHPYGTPPLVRRKDNRLETTMGVEVPWAHAVKMFIYAQQCYQTRTAATVEPGKVAIGHFTLDSINEDGTLKAGCHTLRFPDMLALACQEVPELVSVTARYPLPVIVEG